MAKVATFMLADEISNAFGPNNVPIQSLVNPQAVLRPRYIPGMFSFAICIGIMGLDITLKHSIFVSIVDPTGAQIQDPIPVNIDIPNPDGSDAIPVEYQTLTICFALRNFPIEQEGAYKLIVRVDGEDLEAKDMPVIRGKLAKK